MSCNLQRQYIADTVKNVFAGKKSVKPVAIITYGVTGSGKGNCLSSYLHNHGSENHNTYEKDSFVEINIDNLVESLDDYRTLVKKSRNNLEKTDAYFECRKQVDSLSSLLFQKAIAEKMNVIYETTGNNVDWLRGDLVKLRESGYVIVVVYPFVTWTVLNKRLDQREKNSERKIDRKNLAIGFKNAMDNFTKVLPFVDFAYIYNNNIDGAKYMEPIFEYDGTITHNKKNFVFSCAAKLPQVSDDGELAEHVKNFLKKICFGDLEITNKFAKKK